MQEYQQAVLRRLSDVQQEVQVQQVASREEVDNLRHELSLAEGSRYQNLHTTSRIWRVRKFIRNSAVAART